jgi:hypothetical protein
MSSGARIARRTLIAAVAAAGFFAPAETPLVATRRLKAAMRHPLSARTIGAAYLAHVPAEADADVLTTLTLEAMTMRAEEIVAMAAPALRAAIAAQVRRDFAEGATVAMEGWILSRTEARLCGLWV